MIGEPPTFFNPLVLIIDIEKIINFYTFSGFYGTRVHYSYNIIDSRFIEVELEIIEGRYFIIDSLKYAGLEYLPDSLKTPFLIEKIIQIDSKFSNELLINERNRIETFLKNNGYYFFNKDSIKVTVDTLNSKCGIYFHINLSKQYRIGKTTIHINKNLSLKDSIFTSYNTTKLNMHVYNGETISFPLIAGYLDYKDGDIASSSRLVNTVNNLYRSRVFLSPTISLDSVFKDTVSLSIFLRTAIKHDFSLRIQLDNRYISSAFISGIFSYTNKNILGIGANFAFSTSAGIQLANLTIIRPNQEVRTYLPYNIEIETSFTFPSFIAINHQLKLSVAFSSSNTYSIDLQTYNVTVLGIFNISQYIHFNVHFLQLEVINANNYVAVFTGTKDEAYFDLNLHSIIKFELFFNYFSQIDHTFVLKGNLSVEDSGSLAFLLNNYVLPTSPLGYLFGVKYWQYLKSRLLFSFTYYFTDRLAFKIRSDFGCIFPYGISHGTPAYKNFFSGGQNSLRGWTFNAIGPGFLKQSLMGGNILAQLSFDLTYYFFSNENFGFGLALFTDTGNTWTLDGENSIIKAGFQAIALSPGIGARISTPIGVIQLDFAYPLRDPSSKSLWSPAFDIDKFVFSINISANDLF